MSKIWRTGIAALGLSMAIGATAQTSEVVAGSRPQQPVQPLRGPGGSEVSSHSVIRIKIADGAQGGWLFLPAKPAPVRAPVVVFCHGWGAMLPQAYQAWINHLVMRGNIVLWPNYQDRILTPTKEVVPNAIVAVRAGIHILQSDKYGVQPDFNRVAVVGHSAGAMVAAGIAASAEAEELPRIKAVMPVEPGDSQRGGMASVPLANLSHLPSDTLMIILVGQEDTSVGTHDGERILHESTSVPASNKALFMLHSDAHGSPALVANHYSPTAVLNPDGSYVKRAVKPAISRNRTDIGVVDTLDYFRTWRLLDELLDAAFATPENHHLFSNPAILNMGVWSDGVPVKPLTRLN